MSQPIPVVTNVSVQLFEETKLMGREEFLALPLSKRMRLIMSLKVQFISGNGQLVSIQEGLKDLTRSAA